MAIVLDTNTGFDGGANPTSFTVSGADRLLIAGVAYWGDISSPSSPTYNGDPLTKLLTYNYAAVGKTLDIWYLIAPDTGAHDIAASSWGYAGSVVVSSWTGVDQITPFGTPVTAQNNSATPSRSITAAVDEVVIDLCGVLVGVANASSPQIQLNSNPNFADEFNASNSYRAGSGSSFDMVRDDLGTSRHWSMIAVALKPAGGGGGGVPMNRRGMLFGV